MYSVIKGEVQIVEKLIQAGANLNTRDKSGLTVIHHLCKTNYVNILHVLKTKHEDFEKLKDERTNGGVTPIMYAV